MTPEQTTLFREWLETKAQNALEAERNWAQGRTNPKASSHAKWVNYSGDPAFAAGLAVAFHRAAEKLATIIAGQPERVGLSATTREPYLANRKAAEEWAEDGDRDAYAWLERHPEAIAFGVDDGAIRVAFIDIHAAGEWLKEVLP